WNRNAFISPFRDLQWLADLGSFLLRVPDSQSERSVVMPVLETDRRDRSAGRVHRSDLDRCSNRLELLACGQESRDRQLAGLSWPDPRDRGHTAPVSADPKYLRRSKK